MDSLRGSSHDRFFRAIIKRKASNMMKHILMLLNGRHQNSYCLCNLHRIQTLPNGCKKHYLNYDLKEELYVKQRLGFEDGDYPKHVFKFDTALYGLKQALKSYHDLFPKFLLKNEFKKGNIDNILFLKKGIMSFSSPQYMWMTLFLKPHSLFFVKSLPPLWEMN